jgi:hypothetical protein
MIQFPKILSSIKSIIERRGGEWLTRVIEIIHPFQRDIFLDRLYQEISSIVRYIEQTAQYRQKDTEDRTTIEIVGMLRQAGYDASHDKDHRGHPDFCVESMDFLWLGEAKIHKSYNWLLDGLKQLHTRYSTGREDGSGILIYIYGMNAKAVMDEWRERLEARNECNLKQTNNGQEKLTFWSLHQHTGSGLDLQTKHIGISLYYNPEK